MCIDSISNELRLYFYIIKVVWREKNGDERENKTCYSASSQPFSPGNIKQTRELSSVRCSVTCNNFLAPFWHEGRRGGGSAKCECENFIYINSK